MSDEATYASPTTPGLMVTFKNYLVELVCLNKQRRLPPRFWKRPEWHKRYANEIRGVARWAKLHWDRMDDPLFQKAVIQAIKWVQPATMMTNYIHTKLDRRVEKEYERLVAVREEQAAKAPPPPPTVLQIPLPKNSDVRVVPVGERSRFSRIVILFASRRYGRQLAG